MTVVRQSKTSLCSQSYIDVLSSIAYFKRARCDPEFWIFLLRLLPLSSSAGGILKKHNILQLISKALSEAALSQKRDLTSPTVLGRDEDIDMEHEEIYSTPKERLSSDSSASSPEQILLLRRTPSRLQGLLASVSGVLSYIQENLGAGRRDGNIVAVLRGTAEIGAQILGSFLEACHVLIQEGIEIENEWINTVVNVWRSCVWGNPQLKKVQSDWILLYTIVKLLSDSWKNIAFNDILNVLSSSRNSFVNDTLYSI